MKTVIEMAREAGLHCAVLLYIYGKESALCDSEIEELRRLERFAELVRADERNSWPAEMEAMERQVNILTDALAQEREACANLVFHSPPSDEYQSPLVAVYNAIRARSNP